MRRQTLFGSENLLARFAADDRLEIAHHGWIGMRAKNRAEKIMRRAHVGHPVAHGLVDGVLQCFAAGLHANHFGAQHAHPRHVERLPRHIFRAHIHGALQSEMRGNCGRRDAVLARAGLSNDARLAHFHGEKALADGVVDFVRAGMQQILALQINARSAELRCKARSKLQRRGTPGEILQQFLKFGLKSGIGLGEFVDALQFKQRHHQRFGDVASAVRTETARDVSRDSESCAHGNEYCRIDGQRCDMGWAGPPLAAG